MVLRGVISVNMFNAVSGHFLTSLHRYFRKFEKYTPHPKFPDVDATYRSSLGLVKGMLRLILHIEVTRISLMPGQSGITDTLRKAPRIS